MACETARNGPNVLILRAELGRRYGTQRYETQFRVSRHFAPLKIHAVYWPRSAWTPAAVLVDSLQPGAGYAACKFAFSPSIGAMARACIEAVSMSELAIAR